MGTRITGIKRDPAVVTIAGRKGGSGKTTLAMSLAVQAFLRERYRRKFYGDGLSSPPELVGLIDTDPNGTLTKWSDRRKNEWPVLWGGRSEPGNIGRALDAMGEAGTRLVFIDSPPGHVSTRMEEAVNAADLVLIPTQANPLDLLAVEGMVEMAKANRRPYKVVLSNVQPRQKMTGRASDVLMASGLLLQPVIHRRVGFSSLQEYGLTVSEMDRECRKYECRGPEEILDLWMSLDRELTDLGWRGMS